MRVDPLHTYGPPGLCVWKVAPGTFRFQTTDPRYSRKLDQRQDTGRVAVTGVNHYRRTYEMRGNWRKVKGIVNRYVMRTGDTFSGAVTRQRALEIAPRVKTAEPRKDAAFVKLPEIAGTKARWATGATTGGGREPDSGSRMKPLWKGRYD